MATAQNHQSQLPEVKDQGGRPTDFRAEFVLLAYHYALLGATDQQMAELFNVCERTLNTWKLKHPRFLQSLKKGKSLADCQVAESLFRRATGYSHPAVKIFQSGGKSFEHHYTEHYPPDTTAAIFWLKNRQPAIWRDKTHLEHGGAVEAPQPMEEMTVEDLRALLRRRGVPPIVTPERISDLIGPRSPTFGG